MHFFKPQYINQFKGEVMKKNMMINASRWMLMLSALLLSACSMRLVSEYDVRSLEQMEQIVQKIDFLYLQMENTPKAERAFTRFQNQYLEVMSELNVLHLRQQARESNEQTTKQVKIALDLWQQDLSSHRAKNTLSDFIIKRHRAQYMRLLNAMIQGEQFKQIDSTKV